MNEISQHKLGPSLAVALTMSSHPASIAQHQVTCISYTSEMSSPGLTNLTMEGNVGAGSKIPVAVWRKCPSTSKEELDRIKQDKSVFS